MRFSFWDFIDKIEDLWPWHGQAGEDDENVDPNLNPVLLIPGIGGSILDAVDEKGNRERIWVRLFAADHEFRTKLWSLYDKKTGRTESIDKSISIDVPSDRHGLYACDILDPGLILRLDVVYYYHDIIEQMLAWGYKEGTTLFGFPYDFRQSNRLPERMKALKEKLEYMYELSGGKKVNVVSHSMGGLIVKCFLGLYPEVFEKYVNTWIAVTCPFQGAPGFIMDCLLTGCEFVKGWQRELFIAKWSMHQLLIECPAIYELMATPSFNWYDAPELRVWRQRTAANGLSETELEAFGPEDCVTIMMAALQNNTLEMNGDIVPAPLNHDILTWAMETRRILDSAKLPKTVTFYNVFGVGLDTPLHVCYGSEGSPIQVLDEILKTQGDFSCVDGDGTVPAESAMADGLNAKARLGIPGDHRGILNDERLFRVLKHWLKAGDPDPFYNPLNDYVIIPTKAEFEKHKRELVQISRSGESKEALGRGSDDKEDYVVSLMEKEYTATVSSSSGVGSGGNDGKDDVRAEAHAHVTRPHPHPHPHPSSSSDHCKGAAVVDSAKGSEKEEEDDGLVEIDTVGVAEGADAEKTAAALDEAIAAATEEAEATLTSAGGKVISSCTDSGAL